MAQSLLALAFIGALIWAYHFRNDQYLAQFIMEGNNSSLRGRLELGRVHWNASSLIHLAVGTPAPVQVTHFAVYDPWGARVIHVPRAKTRVDLLQLLIGGHLLLYDVQAERAACTVVARPDPSQGGAEVVGLVEAFASPTPDKSDERGPRVELNNVTLGSVELDLRFASWGVQLFGITARADFGLTGGPTEKEGVLFDVRARAPRGTLTILSEKIPLRRVLVSRFRVTPDDPQSLWFDLNTLAGGSPLQARGRLTNTYRENTGVELELSSRAPAAVVQHVTGAAIGDKAQVLGTIRGPLSGPRIVANFRGVALGKAPLRVSATSGRAMLDFGANLARLTELSGETLGGHFTGEGSLNLTTGHWSAALALLRLDASPLADLLGGRLGGTVRLKGIIGEGARTSAAEDRLLAVLDLKLRDRPRDWLPRTVAAAGSVHLDGSRLVLAGVRLRGDGQSLDARGTVDTETLRLNLRLGLRAPALQPWLSRHRLPIAARSATAQLAVSGFWPRLRASGELSAEGVGYDQLRLRRLAADLAFDGKTLRLSGLRARGYDGKIRGSLAFSLFAGAITRPRRTPLLSGALALQGFDLAALELLPEVRGRLDARVQLSGPLAAPQGTATFTLPRLMAFGQRYDGSTGRVGLLADRISIYRSRFPRRGGGLIRGWGGVFFDGRLDLRLEAEDFPLQAVPRVAELPLDLRGKIRGRVTLSGTLSDPRLAGTVALAEARVRGIAMGSGAVTLTPGSDVVRIQGDLLGKVLRLDGYFLTEPRARLHLRVDVARFPLEKLLYEVRSLGDVRGLLDGSLRLDLDARDGLTWAKGRFDKLQVSLRHRVPGELTPTVVTLENLQDLLLDYNGTRLDLTTTRMVTRVQGKKGQDASFTVGGSLEGSAVDMTVRGVVSLAILEFFLGERVKKLSGRALTNVKVAGTLAEPLLQGSLSLERAVARMPGFSEPLRLPRAELVLQPGALLVQEVRLNLGGQELAARGKVNLDGIRPTTLDLRLDGALNVKLLELFFPSHVSRAAGTTQLKVTATGPLRDPAISGTLAVGRIEVSPRGWGRTITLTSGEVAFDNYLLEVARPLRGTYDEGLVQVDGEMRLDGFEVVDLYLQLVGTGIPQRQPNVYNAEVNLDVTLAGDSRRLELRGDLELVDLRYVRKFDVFKQALIKPKVYEAETPFYKGWPLLENLKLSLDVRSTGLIEVKNNIAELGLSGDVTVSGVLSDPRLDGLVRVEEGTFKLPGLRGEFTINRGEILFAESRPLERALVNIVSETLFEGRNQLDYQIRLQVQGPLENPGIVLSSSPALDQGQIWSLLAFGRTTDQLRSQLGGGSGEASRSGDAAGAADAQVKQLTGEILSHIVEDPLKKVTRLDVINLEVGTESAQIRAGKRLGRYVNLAGEYELGLLGDSRAEGRLEVRMHDLLMLVGKWERLSTRLETEEEDPSRGRIELKLKLPLR